MFQLAWRLIKFVWLVDSQNVTFKTKTWYNSYLTVSKYDDFISRSSFFVVVTTPLLLIAKASSVFPSVMLKAT